MLTDFISILPLATANDSQTINITENLVNNVLEHFGEGFNMIGRGIGGVMLLFVVIYYVMQIMDGAQFQLKMIIPLIIYLFVCNFSWIATPVTKFTTTITSSLVDLLAGQKEELIRQYGGPDASSINDMFWYMKNPDARPEPEEETKESNGFIAQTIQTGMNKAVDDQMDKIIQSTSSTASSDSSGREKKETPKIKLTFSGVVCSILDWVANAISFALKCLGSVMTAIITCFGPITFAFAIYPGRAQNMLTWFIRLCQFSLYSPLCYLIELLVVLLFINFGTGSLGFLMLLGTLICSLVCLTTVPTIASMIIEGASGAVSLSSGLQSIGSSLTTGGTVVGGMGILLAGKDNAVANAFRGAKELGVSGMAREFKNNGFSKGLSSIGSIGQAARKQ